jgi:hypothetical protein
MIIYNLEVQLNLSNGLYVKKKRFVKPIVKKTFKLIYLVPKDK